VIPWGAIARILLRIGGAVLLNRVIEALHGLGHHAPAPIDMSAAEVAHLEEHEIYPEDEQENALGCPRNDDRWGGHYDPGDCELEDWEDWETL
jgi:hypothetical protein